MKILFVHQNFPGQYRHLAAHYAAQKGNLVVGIGEKANVLRQGRIPSVQLLGYTHAEKEHPDRFTAPALKAIERGKQVAAGALQLRRQGFDPDIVFGKTECLGEERNTEFLDVERSEFLRPLPRPEHNGRQDIQTFARDLDLLFA